MIIEGARSAGCQAVSIQLAAQRHIAGTVDQAVVTIIQRLHADIHPLTSRQRGGSAVFRQVVENISLYANAVAIDPATADIGQHRRLQQRLFAVDQPIVGQLSAKRQPVLSGIDFAGGSVQQVGGAQIELAARQQFTAVVNIACGCEVEIAVGNHLATVVQALLADQRDVTQGEDLSVTRQAIGTDR